MKKVNLLLLSICTCFALQAQTHADTLINILKNTKSNYIFVASHRGDWRNEPENSIKALKNCIAMGVDIAETDVQLSKDSILVLMHDKTIERTTTGKGKISDYTYAELQNFVLKGGQGIKTYEKIPTFEEYMLTAKGKILVNVDKGWKCLDKVVEVLRKTGTLNHAIIKGEDTYEMMQARYGSLMDSIYYTPVVLEKRTDLSQYVDSYIKNVPNLAFEVLYATEDSPMFVQMKKMEKCGKRIWVNTLWNEMCAGHDDERAIVDPKANWGWIIDHGASFLQTDRPAILIKYLETIGRRNTGFKK